MLFCSLVKVLFLREILRFLGKLLPEKLYVNLQNHSNIVFPLTSQKIVSECKAFWGNAHVVQDNAKSIEIKFLLLSIFFFSHHNVLKWALYSLIAFYTRSQFFQQLNIS